MEAQFVEPNKKMVKAMVKTFAYQEVEALVSVDASDDDIKAALIAESSLFSHKTSFETEVEDVLTLHSGDFVFFENKSKLAACVKESIEAVFKTITKNHCELTIEIALGENFKLGEQLSFSYSRPCSDYDSELLAQQFIQGGYKEYKFSENERTKAVEIVLIDSLLRIQNGEGFADVVFKKVAELCERINAIEINFFPNWLNFLESDRKASSKLIHCLS